MYYYNSVHASQLLDEMCIGANVKAKLELKGE
jgi:hypothetical protein